MSPSDEQTIRDITGALFNAIVVIVRSIESQMRGELRRSAIIAALESAAKDIHDNSDNVETTRAIIRNIAVALEDGDRKPIRLTLGNGKS